MEDRNILLVDDDKDGCASMSDIFLDLGYTVDTAYEGLGALELSRQHLYHLALIDYKMPGMDGLELCRRLKISQPNIVVALITAFASIATLEAVSEAGIRCFFPKPVDFALLIPLVEEVAGERVDNMPIEIGLPVLASEGLFRTLTD